MSQEDYASCLLEVVIWLENEDVLFVFLKAVLKPNLHILELLSFLTECRRFNDEFLMIVGWHHDI